MGSNNGANRLISFSDPVGRIIGQYVYNGAGDRLAQTVNGRRTEYLLDASNPLTEVVGEFGAGEPTYYLLGLDVIGSQTGQDWSYFGYDGLGSTRFVTDSLGAMTSATRYDPYGGVLDQVNAINTNLGFAGEFTDANGLINLRARFYSPSLGTFLNRDPVLGLVGGRASHWNPYVYVHGNPVNMTDPSGKLAPLLVGMGIAALGGGVVGGLAGGGINLVSQLMSHRGNFACVNWGDVANAAFDGMVMGGIGGMVGFMSGPSMLGIGVAAAADVAIGTAYDTLRYGTPPSESLMNNMIALGLGQGVGVAVKKAFKAAGSDVVNEVLHGRLSVSRLGRSLRGVRDDVVGGLRGAADDVGRLLRGRLRPAGGALDWDDGFGPRVLRMANHRTARNTSDWIDDLIVGRSISSQKNVDLLDAVNLVRQRLVSRKIGIRSEDVLSMLEVDGRWYLGANSTLDRLITKNYGGSIIADRVPDGLIGRNKHAETNAVSEYFTAIGGRRSSGISGRMAITRAPCSNCVFGDVPTSPYPGSLNQTIWSAGISNLDVRFSGSVGRFSTSKFTILAVDPRR